MSTNQEERRRTPRTKLFQLAEMRRGVREARVHLLNLSTTGALVYGEGPPAVGEEVRLRCGLSLGTGHVAWVSGRRFGVQFATPLPAAVVDHVVRVHDGMIESASKRLGVPCLRMAMPAA